jgi:hypothetical protein
MFEESMPQPVVPHSVPQAKETARSARVRLRGALIAVSCVAVLGGLALLTASKDGFGTHQQLGLPYCSFLARTGYPCPTCGVTTSMTEAVHGHLIRAWNAHPLGVLLSAGLGALAVVGAWELCSGRAKLPTGRRALGLAVGFLAVGLGGGWAWKVAYGVLNGSLPLR